MSCKFITVVVAAVAGVVVVAVVGIIHVILVTLFVDSNKKGASRRDLSCIALLS